MDVPRQTLKTFMADASYARMVHSITIPNDVAYTDLLKPAYWGQLANQVKVGGIMEVQRVDPPLDVTFRIIAVERGMVHLRPLPYYRREVEDKILAERGHVPTSEDEATARNDAASVIPDGLEDYKIGMAGNSGFYVSYKPTRETLKSKIATKAEAVAFAVAHKARGEGMTA